MATENNEQVQPSLQSKSGLQKEQKRWERILQTFPEEQQQEIKSATAALQSTNRLLWGKHLNTVRNIVVPQLVTDPQIKVGTKDPNAKKWATFLRANLRGASRSSTYDYMNGWVAAEAQYPEAYLAAFLSSPLSLEVRPSKEKPLGRYTEAAKELLASGNVAVTEENAMDVVNATRAVYEVQHRAELAARKANQPDWEDKYGVLVQKICDATLKALKTIMAEAAKAGVDVDIAFIRETHKTFAGRLLSVLLLKKTAIEPLTVPNIPHLLLYKSPHGGVLSVMSSVEVEEMQRRNAEREADAANRRAEIEDALREADNNEANSAA